MSDFYSVKQICEQIFTLEKEYDLLNFDIGGVKIWNFMRMPIYYDIAIATGVLSTPHPKQSIRSRSQLICSSLFSSVVRNPLLVKGPVDALILPHPRKVADNGYFIDCYTHFLVKELEAKGQRCILLEKTEGLVCPGSLARKSLRTDFVSWLKELTRFLGVGRCTKEERKTIKFLNSLVNDTFGLSLDLTSKLSNQVQQFRLYHNYYKILLKQLRPTKIYITVAYSWGALIKAAKDLNIEVLEVQHGVFSRYHLGYSFPGVAATPSYFPDKLLTWGHYWSETPELPLSKSARIDFGFEYFHYKKSEFIRCQKKEWQILVLSQGAVSKYLPEWIFEIAIQLPDYSIIYKLHPSEYKTWRSKEEICKLDNMSNVFIASEGSSLYSLFRESRYQAGVFSTAIFEGIGMGCKTILFDLPGIEYMQELIDKKFCVKCANTEHIKKDLCVARKINTSHVVDKIFGISRSEFYEN